MKAVNIVLLVPKDVWNWLFVSSFLELFISSLWVKAIKKNRENIKTKSN